MYTNHTLNVTPAYGTVYVDEMQMLDDWNNGKDFKIINGPYFSIRDKMAIREEMGVTRLCVYNLPSSEVWNIDLEQI